MTIYSQISYNKIRTIILTVLFIIFFSFVFFLIGQYTGNPRMYFILGLIISTLSSIGSYFYSDKIVLLTTGAKPANKKEHFNFYTVCENLSIASGLPMPKLYVINDPSPNAFATGRNPKHAVVCVTTGLLEKLDRAELEGVISHELSHIKNFDILLSSIVAVLVGALVIATDWVTRGWWFRGFRDRDRVNPAFLVIIFLMLILTPLIATIIQLAISRKREYLADATGALLTRNPDALAQALEKITSDTRSLAKVSGATAHLFISDPLRKESITSKFASLFSTHPPIDERVKILRNM